MNIKQLHTFLVLTEKMNFTETALQIGYAQSTITTQIKLLEEELGTPLFERLGKTIVLTAAGQRLLPYAKDMVQLEHKIISHVPESESPSGTLKIGVAESLCYTKFPKLLQDYKSLYPNVDIQLKFINHTTFPQLLQEGLLDFVYTINTAYKDDNFLIPYSQPESLDFLVSPNHPLTQCKMVVEEDIAKYPLLLTDANCNFRIMLLSDLARKGLTCKIALETSSKEILKQFAANGHGIAFIPSITAQNELADHSLVKLKWGGMQFPIMSQIIIHKNKLIMPEIEAFWHIYETYSQNP